MPEGTTNKPNLRNTRIFREELLTALGNSDDRDVENENNFKEALLDALGVEYAPADVRNFETFREKLVEGIANGGSGGGGGSSDLSTAEVTFVCTANSYGVRLPQVISIPGVDEYMGLNPYEDYVDTESPITAIVPLYKGKAILSLSAFANTDGSITPTTDGGVALDLENGEIIITGDGSFTAAGIDGGGGGDDTIST